MYKEDHIICAVSTPPGVGGIAVIRLSGRGCIELTDKIFIASGNKKLTNQLGNTLHFGTIQNVNNAILDEVLVSVFKAPHSFTGEDSIEISCHGSHYIQQELINSLLQQGAHLATKGEFTKRAFVNGKMDLSQAESVADLIASTSAATHRIAMNQMRGGISSELSQLRTQLLNFVSLIELELDFSEEEVEFANRNKLHELAIYIQDHINKLICSFNLGNAIKKGIPVAIIGETNTGKSTLLNLLLHDEKAIVSDIHGTTRDIIEDVINIKGIDFRLIDTAGIRKTTDTIEAMGIERSFLKMKQADIVLWVIDAETDNQHIIELADRILPQCMNKKLVLVFNKTDLISGERKRQKEILFQDKNFDRIFISAKYVSNAAQLEDLLVQAANIGDIGEQDVIITNMRHVEALQKANDAILRVIDGLNANISGDFLSQDIRECMFYLGEITGDISTEDILGNIFSKFCIGK